MKKCVLFLLSLTLLTITHSVLAQGTAFNYQGQLMDSGVPANGLYDLQFIIYDASAGGDEVGPILTNGPTTVINGLFTVELDFGSNIFTGSNYWLDIAARTNGSGAFAELSPRQPLTPTPYAIFANSASNLLGSLPVDKLSGTIALTQLPGTVVTNDEGGVTLSNATLTGNLSLPASTAAAGIIFAGTNTLVHADTINDFYAGPGAGSLTNLSGGNTGIGYVALKNNTNGANNTANGYRVLANNTSGNNNTANGEQALYLNTSGSDNTAVGRHALGANTNGNNNVATGYLALADNASGSDSVAVGYEALGLTTNDSELVAIGFQALQNDDAANIDFFTPSSTGENTAVGYQSLRLDSSGAANTAVGYLSLAENISGFSDTAIGDRALQYETNGYGNTAIGAFALYTNFDGFGNVAVGWSALYNDENDSQNIAIGTAALGALTNGDGNIAIGYYAGASLQEGTNNIYIGNSGANESGITRIGTTGTQTSAYVAGQVVVDHGLNVDVQSTYGQNTGNVLSNALTFGTGPGGSGEGIASKRVGVNVFDLEFYTGFNNRVTIANNGFVGIGTTNPAYLLQVGNADPPAYCNGSSWVNGSDRNGKKNFADIDPRAVLEKVSALPITQWQYKAEADGTEHLGPMAQDFHAAFGLNGADDKHIATVDEEGVALAAIQGLNQKVEDQLQEKDAQIQELKQSVADLKKMVQALAEKK